MEYKGTVEIDFAELTELQNRLHAACDLLEEVAMTCSREHFEKVMKFLKEVE